MTDHPAKFSPQILAVIDDILKVEENGTQTETKTKLYSMWKDGESSPEQILFEIMSLRRAETQTEQWDFLQGQNCPQSPAIGQPANQGAQRGQAAILGKDSRAECLAAPGDSYLGTTPWSSAEWNDSPSSEQRPFRRQNQQPSGTDAWPASDGASSGIRRSESRKGYTGETGLIVLDPFCGIGGVHSLAHPGLLTFGVEIEPEWATCHPMTEVGDARALRFDDDTFDCICTSPVFGNRMADHHDAKDDSKRITYKHSLGRDLTPGNAGAMQWGSNYRSLHLLAWKEARRVLKPGGLMIVNIKNHIRGGKIQPVAEWHLTTLLYLGFLLEEVRKVKCPGMGFGANADARVPFEHILVLRKEQAE